MMLNGAMIRIAVSASFLLLLSGQTEASLASTSTHVFADASTVSVAVEENAMKMSPHNVQRQQQTNEKLPMSHHRRRFLQALADGPADLTSVCAVVQSMFATPVKCDCFGSAESFLTISCDYQTPICGSTGKNCGRPLIGVSMVDGHIFSSTTCVREYQRNVGNETIITTTTDPTATTTTATTTRSATLPLGDPCISVTACENPQDGLCECIASYDSKICGKCDICQGGKGIAFDCSNINPEAISVPCSAIDMDLNLADGAGFLGAFVPEMSGLCTNLEKALHNRIACDCSQATGGGGGTYSISCSTLPPDETNNGNDSSGKQQPSSPMVQSKVQVVDGVMASIEACAEQPAPYATTCTALQFCEQQTDRLCACFAMYDGKPCQSCMVCDDGKSVQLDCSNMNANAIVSTCQAVDPASSFEFIPQFPNMTSTTKTPPGQDAASTNKKPASSAVGAMVNPSMWYRSMAVMSALSVWMTLQLV